MTNHVFPRFWYFQKTLIFKTRGFDAKPRVFSQTLRFHRFLVPLVYIFCWWSDMAVDNPPIYQFPSNIWFLMIFLRPVVLRLPTCRWLVAKCQGPQFGTKHAQACDRHPIPTNSTAASCILLAWRTLHSADSWYSCGRVGCHFEASGWIYMEFAYIWPLQTLVSRAKSDTMPVDPNPAMFGTGPADGMTNGGRGDSRAFEPPYHGTIQAIPGHSLIICYC